MFNIKGLKYNYFILTVIVVNNVVYSLKKGN